MHSHLKNFAGYTVFTDPGDFAAAAADYFQWCDDHPLLEEIISFHQGEECRAEKGKMRAYTKQGLANHLGIPVSRLDLYKEKEGWSDVMEIVENVLYQQKFEGAAAGLLNASIISRDLGLADKSEITGADGGPIQTEELSARERIAGKLAGLAARNDPEGDPGGAE